MLGVAGGGALGLAVVLALGLFGCGGGGGGGDGGGGGTAPPPANLPPVAQDQRLTTGEDAAVAIVLAASDPEGDPLVFSLAAPPANGTLSRTPPDLTYTPAADFNGADSFTFAVDDDHGHTAGAAVYVTVTPVNDAPAAWPGSVTTLENAPVSVTVVATDVDGDPLIYALVANVSHGTLAGTWPSLIYTPSHGYSGSDAFTFKVSDGVLDSAPATFSLTVLPVNDAPTARDGTLSVDEDAAGGGTLGAGDPDGDPLTYRIARNGALGVATVTSPASGAYAYAPHANAHGTDSFTFVANDGIVDSSAATVTVTIRPVNDAPVAVADAAATATGTAVDIDVLANDGDMDGDPLAVTGFTQGASGTVALDAGGTLHYTPNTGFAGADGFTYTVGDGQGRSATGSVTVQVVGTGGGAFNYAEALQKALYFFEAQRSGPLPAGNRVEWRGDSGMDDRADHGVDLTGGWYDAGDHVKFGLPMASAATLLSWSVIEYRDAFVRTGELGHVLETIRWATDYFLKAHTADDEFWGQVGDSTLDHNFWGPAEVMPMLRPSFKIDAGCPGSDLAGETAAALAAASVVFEPTDPSYASELLDHAERLFAFADTHRGLYSACITDAWLYSSSGYVDELVWAALWLYQATGDAAYLGKAKTEFRAIDGRVSWTHCWDDKSYGCYVLLAALSPEQKYKDAAERWLDHWTAGPGGGGVQYTPGGLAWISPWGPLRYAANTAFLAMIYGDSVADPAKRARYCDFAVRQIDYILGQNPRGASYVVGFGVNPPTHPHHRTSHGSWLDDIDEPAGQRHVLYGALVGGPDQNDGYVDRRIDYVSNEVAVDYNAGFTGALARLVLYFGGTTLTSFPAPEAREDEFFVEAVSLDASGTEIRTLLNNRSGWPARASDALSFRYFVDLTEVVAAGYGAGEAGVVLDYQEGATLTGLLPWKPDQHLYCVEVSFEGTKIFPGGPTAFRKEARFHFALAPGAAAAWSAANDPSFEGLAQGGDPVKTDRIPVYESGTRLFGVEPPR